MQTAYLIVKDRGFSFDFWHGSVNEGDWGSQEDALRIYNPGMARVFAGDLFADVFEEITLEDGTVGHRWLTPAEVDAL